MVELIFRKIMTSEREENKGKMRYLLGESMGGAMALLLHRMKGDYWDGAILVAPMCKVMSYLLRLVLNHRLSLLCPFFLSCEILQNWIHVLFISFFIDL